MRTCSPPSMLVIVRILPNVALKSSQNSCERRCVLPMLPIKTLASGPTRAMNRRLNARILKIGPNSRYCLVRKARRSPVMAKALPISGNPLACGISLRGEAAREAGGSSSRMALATDCPIRSSWPMRLIRSCTAACSDLDRMLSKTPQASARQIITISRGSGISSLKSTRITRSRTSSTFLPAMVG